MEWEHLYYPLLSIDNKKNSESRLGASLFEFSPAKQEKIPASSVDKPSTCKQH